MPAAPPEPVVQSDTARPAEPPSGSGTRAAACDAQRNPKQPLHKCRRRVSPMRRPSPRRRSKRCRHRSSNSGMRSGALSAARSPRTASSRSCSGQRGWTIASLNSKPGVYEVAFAYSDDSDIGTSWYRFRRRRVSTCRVASMREIRLPAPHCSLRNHLHGSRAYGRRGETRP